MTGIKGGRGPENKGIQCKVIYAPMSMKCARLSKNADLGIDSLVSGGHIREAMNMAGGIPPAGKNRKSDWDNRSEQNWQASALSALKRAMAKAHEIPGAPGGQPRTRGRRLHWRLLPLDHTPTASDNFPGVGH
jgi:hypothetical protein